MKLTNLDFFNKICVRMMCSFINVELKNKINFFGYLKACSFYAKALRSSLLSQNLCGY